MGVAVCYRVECTMCLCKGSIVSACRATELKKKERKKMHHAVTAQLSRLFVKVNYTDWEIVKKMKTKRSCN